MLEDLEFYAIHCIAAETYIYLPMRSQKPNSEKVILRKAGICRLCD